MSELEHCSAQMSESSSPSLPGDPNRLAATMLGSSPSSARREAAGVTTRAFPLFARHDRLPGRGLPSSPPPVLHSDAETCVAE